MAPPSDGDVAGVAGKGKGDAGGEGGGEGGSEDDGGLGGGEGMCAVGRLA